MKYCTDIMIIVPFFMIFVSFKLSLIKIYKVENSWIRGLLLRARSGGPRGHGISTIRLYADSKIAKVRENLRKTTVFSPIKS